MYIHSTLMKYSLSFSEKAIQLTMTMDLLKLFDQRAQDKYKISPARYAMPYHNPTRYARISCITTSKMTRLKLQVYY